MFKSGKSITVSGQKISSSGVQVAPTINLLGLILKASQQIHPKVKKFLNDRGLVVSHIQEDGDKLVHVTGEYELGASEVSEFIKANPNAVISLAEEKEEKDERDEAINFQRQLQVKIINKFAYKNPIIVQTQFTSSNITLDHNSTCHSSVNLDLHDGSYCHSKAAEYIENDFIIRTKRFYMDGFTYLPQFGVLQEINAGAKVVINAQLESRYKDMFILAGKAIEISSDLGCVDIILTPRIPWQNYPSIPSLFFHPTGWGLGHMQLLKPSQNIEEENVEEPGAPSPAK